MLASYRVSLFPKDSGTILIFRPGFSDPEIREKVARPTLAQVQAIVGGYIELVDHGLYAGIPVQILVDEEGRLKGKQPNSAACLWMSRVSPRLGHIPIDFLVGNVVVLLGRACLD